MLFSYLLGLHSCTLVKGITGKWVFGGKKSCLLIFSENEYYWCIYEDIAHPFMCVLKVIDDAEILNFNDLAIKNGIEVEILGITLDRNMNFHIILKIFVEKQVKN